MSILVKTGLGLGVIGGIGGASYGIYSTMQSTPEKPNTYAEELEGTLLSVNAEENREQWEARLKSLNDAQDDTLIPSIKAIKDKKQPAANVATWQDVRDWCKDIIVKENKGKEDKEFKNIQNYCTFSIKEKLEKAIKDVADNDDSEWALGRQALKGIEDNELLTKLQEAKKKQDGAEGNKAVKDWCNGVFDKPYKGIKDQEFENASKVCVTK